MYSYVLFIFSVNNFVLAVVFPGQLSKTGNFMQNFLKFVDKIQQPVRKRSQKNN